MDDQTRIANLEQQVAALQQTLAELRRDLRERLDEKIPDMLVDVTQQLEHRERLHRLLQWGPGHLPPTRRWALSPDALIVMVEHLLAHPCKRLVECGSGVSTVAFARLLQLQGGAGHLYSLESNEAFAGQVAGWLRELGLERFVTLITGTRSYTFQGVSFNWYEQRGLTTEPIDFLLVDGPPTNDSPLARYPAAPILFPRLAPGAHVFVDDFNRPGEQRMFEVWRAEFPLWQPAQRQTEKGLGVLIKPGAGH